MNRPLKRRYARTAGHQGVELENHFILRLPHPQAEEMRALLQSSQSAIIKDRLHIQLDHTNDKDDMRNGIITIDTRMHKARLVDLPTIIESWKTINGKSFYKTADICQMLMVREGEDAPEEEDSKKKKRDPNRVEKKYLWPHGYTPPLKNVRKRRFRKMLRKKIMELPEIEKEVKRLLRADEEAFSVKWEVVKEEDEKGGGSTSTGGVATSARGSAGASAAGGGSSAVKASSSMIQDDSRGTAPGNLDEQLFGEMVSSSEDEAGPTINIMDEDEDSRLSVEDSRMSDTYTLDNTNSPSVSTRPQMSSLVPTASNSLMADQQFSSSSLPTQPSSSVMNPSTTSASFYPTEFTSSMFKSDPIGGATSVLGGASFTIPTDLDDSFTHEANDNNMQSMNKGGLSEEAVMELASLEEECRKLKEERTSHQLYLDDLDNQALRSRFLAKLNDINDAIAEKEAQIGALKRCN